MVTFAAAKGTAAGCKISGSSLRATSAGTCVVIATKAGDASYLRVSSSATTITFAPKVSSALPAVVTVLFTAKSSALSARSKVALQALAKQLRAGASVTVTGYAMGNTALAQGRATTIANYLWSRGAVLVTIKSVTTVAVDKATVTTLKQ